MPSFSSLSLLLHFPSSSCHREAVGADKQVIVSGVPWGIDAAEAVRLTQSAPSLSGNRRQCGKKRRGQEVEVRRGC